METGVQVHVQRLRQFNRFYTRRIGLLERHFLGSPMTLTEGRVLYELGQRNDTTAAAIGAELGLDAGYLSRILGRFERQGMIARRRCPEDGRRTLITLTPAGRAAFDGIDRASSEEITALIQGLSEPDQRRLTAAADTMERLLGLHDPGRDCTIRTHRPGDLGWIVARHGALYAEEHGFDARFEALVAGVVARFAESFDGSRERCWIAELDGRPVGSVLLARKTDEVAQLRLLLLEPEARGVGLGRRLVESCLGFAREAGYRRVSLWTNDVLIAARAMYERAGFRLVGREPHNRFGPALVGETWELEL
jgi:DNA-binding MarR family transcriptional regulator/N-acetylglutamate synthase-like GNAT family acetyltransferase